MSNETIWNPKAARKAAPTRNRTAEKRLYLVGSSEKARLFSRLGLSLAADVPGRRRSSHEGKAGTGASAKADAWPKEDIDTNSAERSSFVRIPYRVMDAKTCGRSDREKIRHSISSESFMAFSNGSRMELPEARKTSQRARRESHTALEAVRMAAYKKKPIGLVLILSFLTKAASCWFPISDAHGRHGGKLPIFLWRGIGRKYRLFPLSVFLLKESALPSISDSMLLKTSRRRKLKDFCTTLGDILEDMLFFCGIRVRFTKPVWLRNVLQRIKKLAPISFPAMPLNLIPLNLYGLSLKGPLQTPYPRIWVILKRPSFQHCTGFVIPSVFYGLAYGLRICHGNKISITYA